MKFNENKVEKFKDFLFPNKSVIFDKVIDELSLELKSNNLQLPNSSPSQYHRDLKTPYTGDVPCVICRGLTYCSAINGLMLQEVYYPQDLSLLGSCYVLDAFGKRIYGEIFGNGGTYRDTTECRSIVMQYLCLFYGSNNDMYTNYCIYQEDVSDANPANHKVAPRPPCRSFCVQIATVCANDPEDFLNVCEEIACPPTEDACNPDPLVDGETLSANLGCDMPIYSNPYVRASAAYNLQKNYWNIVFINLVCIWMIFYMIK